MNDKYKTKAQLIEELTKLRQRVAELETLEVERNRELNFLSRDEQTFNSALRLGQVLTIVMEGVRRLLGASICSLWLIDPNSNDLVCRRATGYRYELVQGWRLKPDEGIANWAVRNDQSLIVADTRLDTRHYKEIDRLIGIELRSILSVPLRVQTKVIGTLQVTHTEADHFNPTELNLLEALATTAAAAIENTRLYEQAQQGDDGSEGVAELTKLEDQFYYAQKMEAVGRLAGGVAHNFNNMLTAIMGYSELTLRQLPENHTVRPDIENIQITAQRAAELTSKLLAFARNQIAKNPQVLNLNNYIAQIESSLQQLIGPQIELVLQTEPELGTIEIDPDHLEQIVVNLVANARDAMPEEGQLVLETANTELDQNYVAQYAEVKPGPYIMLAVKDSGQGIDEEIKPHLFEPFFTTKDVGQGTGLGLATCYGLVKQNDGHITVESEPGQGSTFKVYLPQVGSKEPQNKTEEDEGGTQPSNGETILIVEDDVGVRSISARVLRQFGYRVLEARDGQAALELLAKQSEKIDLLITDVLMPNISGKALIDQVRLQQPDVKVLIISGYTGHILQEKGVLDSDIPFLAKPFRPNQLVDKVREVLATQ